MKSRSPVWSVHKLWPVITLLAVLPLCAQEPQDDSKEENQAELVTTPVVYEWGMLVVVSPEGVGGVRFLEPSERGNKNGNGLVRIKYEWRFLAREEGAVEQTGAGVLYANLKNDKVHNGNFEARCGPQKLTWTHKTMTLGSVSYDPRKFLVHPLAVGYFSKKAQRFDHPVIDLRRYSPDNRNAPEGTMGGPFCYQDCVLVARHEQGLATFEFGQPEERKAENAPTLYGIPFRGRFESWEGKIEKTSGKLYEEQVRAGKLEKGQLFLHAGPFKMEWSQSSQSVGWCYYEPETTSVWCVEKNSLQPLLKSIKAQAGELPLP